MDNKKSDHHHRNIASRHVLDTKKSENKGTAMLVDTAVLWADC